MLYCFGFIGLFLIGGLTGLFSPASAWTFTSTTPTSCRPFPLHHGRRRGHGYVGGIHFWWPKITGRLYPETLSESPPSRSSSAST